MRTRSRIALRFFFLASLVLGVVAMHQLPVSHGNPGEHGSPAGQHRAEAGQHGTAEHRTGSGLHDAHGLSGAADAAAAKHGKPLLEADHDSDHAGMLHLCLAILAAGFLLLFHWWLGTRWPGGPVPLRTASRTRVRPRPPPWVQPCVFRLRVLRL